MDPKCPCKYDNKTNQYRNCKGKSCKPNSGQGLNELEKTGKKIKKFVKGLVGLETGGSVTEWTRNSRKHGGSK